MSLAFVSLTASQIAVRHRRIQTKQIGQARTLFGGWWFWLRFAERIYVIDLKILAGGVVGCAVVEVSVGDNGSQESRGI